MRLRGDSEIHGTAAPLGCQVRRLRLCRGQCRGFRCVRLWADGNQTVNLVLAHPTSLPVEEPWYLISNAEPSLDLVWSYAQRFCCEQLFRDQKSGVFQLESSGLRKPKRIDRLLLIVAIAVLAGSLQGYALSLADLRRQVDPHWERGISFLRISLAALQMAVADTAVRLMDWLPIPVQQIEPCIPSRKARREETRVWFSKVELPPRLRSVVDQTPQLAARQEIQDLSYRCINPWRPNQNHRHRFKSTLQANSQAPTGGSSSLPRSTTSIALFATELPHRLLPGLRPSREALAASSSN